MTTLSEMAGRELGPNMRRFVAHRVSVLAIPPGTKNPLAAGIACIMDTIEQGKYWHAAVAWCCAAVDAVKSAPDNPYGDDDEKIAGVILAGIKKTQDERRGRR